MDGPKPLVTPDDFDLVAVAGRGAFGTVGPLPLPTLPTPLLAPILPDLSCALLAFLPVGVGRGRERGARIR